MTARENNKLVLIRIGGTAYSGSTAMGLMLGNDDDGFYCGEVNALFRPYRRHHFKPVCGCGDPQCDIWHSVRTQGEVAWLDHLADIVGDRFFFIDSSKNYDWLLSEVRKNPRYDVKHVLLWKSPQAYAYSRLKRNRMRGWKRAYLNYYKRYFEMVDDCIAVNFTRFTSEPEKALEELCNLLGIPYFEGKHQYWDKVHHSVFGNDSAVMHLHGDGSDALKQKRDRLSSRSERSDSEMNSQHRRIYSDKSTEEKLPPRLREEIANDHRFGVIVDMLSGDSACKPLQLGDYKVSVGTRMNAMLHLLRKRVLKVLQLASGAGR